MRRRAEDVEATRRRLILAGERLFARHGIDGVSLREIADVGGQANNTAVHYHFGSRDGLVAAISAYRIAELETIRQRMLGALPGGAGGASLEDLLNVFMMSQLHMKDEDGNHPYAHFMVQYLTRYRPGGMPHASDVRGDGTAVVRGLLDAIAERLPALDPVTALKRLELLNLTFLAMLMRNDTARQHGEPARPLEQEAQETVTMALAALNVRPAASGH